MLICKGAVANVLEISVTSRAAGSEIPLDEEKRQAIDGKFRIWNEQGFRVLGLATRKLSAPGPFGRADEAGLCLG
ncbi:hypothetical protein [Neorhizobium sp. LjRoot104]|uniref:hypothetical protein n=1 Tax=Neorhizobium sp. LjRoot104 TaxID=3342254 RepID=UPI003ECF7552